MYGVGSAIVCMFLLQVRRIFFQDVYLSVYLSVAASFFIKSTTC